jgi:diaminopimelate decarboxylase
LSERTGKSGNTKAISEAVDSRPFHYHGGTLCCDGVSLDALAEQYVQQAFAGRPFTICYAVKANSTLAILRMLAELGAGFDIVSGGELERVRRANKAALKRVVFSGAGKQIWEIDAALNAGILLFNVESEGELALLAERAEALGVRARFALRVNPDVFADTHPYISTGLREHKFGIDIGQARAIYRRAAKSKWLEAAGVSVHIGSQIRAVAPFAAALARVAGLVGELRKDGHDIRWVDAGGGLGIDYNDSPEQPTFDPARKVKEYAAALGKVKIDAHLLLEPGRFLVAQAGGLLTRVLFVKRNGTKTFVIADAAMNDLIRPALYQAHHEILPVAKTRGAARVVDVVGPVCETGDFFARDRALPKVKPGELVLLLDAGAYGMAQSSNYNTRTRPAEILVDGDQAKLIRRRETLRDLLAPEIL